MLRTGRLIIRLPIPNGVSSGSRAARTASAITILQRLALSFIAADAQSLAAIRTAPMERCWRQISAATPGDVLVEIAAA